MKLNSFVNAEQLLRLDNSTDIFASTTLPYLGHIKENNDYIKYWGFPYGYISCNILEGRPHPPAVDVSASSTFNPCTFICKTTSLQGSYNPSDSSRWFSRCFINFMQFVWDQFAFRKSTRSVKIEWWGAGMVIGLKQGATNLHILQLTPLPPHHHLLR